MALVAATAICVVQLGGAIGYHVSRTTGWLAAAFAIVSALLTVWRPGWALPGFVAFWPLLMGLPRVLAGSPSFSEAWPVPPAFAWVTGLLLGESIVQRRAGRAVTAPGIGILSAAFIALVVVNGVSAVVGVALNLRDALPFSSRYVGRSLLDLLGLGPFDDWAPLAAWLPWVASLGLAVVALSRAADDAFRPRLIVGLVAGGAAQAAIALVQLATADEPLNRQLRAAFGTLPDVHAIGSYLLVSIAACLAAGPAAFRWRPAWWLTTGLLLAGLLGSGSRNSWLAGLALIAAGLGGGFAIVERAPRLKRAMQVVALTTILLGGGAVGFFMSRYGPRDDAWREWDAALTYRLSAFRTAGRIVADHPFAGCGLGRLFGLTPYDRYSGGTAFAEIAPENAHNFFLQQFAEAGPAALAAWCAIWVALLVRCARGDATERAIAMSALALLLTNLLAHSLLVPPFLGLFALLIGSLGGQARRAAAWLMALPVLAALLGAIQLARPDAPVGLHPRLVGLHDWETLPDGSPYRWTRRTTGPRPVHETARWLVWDVKCTHDYVVPETPLRVTIEFDPAVRKPATFSLADRHAWHLLAVEMPPDAPPHLHWSLDAGRALVPNRVRWTEDARPLGVMIKFGGPFARDAVPADAADWQLAPLPDR